MGAYEHQDLPFGKLWEELQRGQAESGTRLFQVKFNLQNSPMPALEIEGLSLRPVDIDSGTSRFDLTLSLMETEQGLTGFLKYSTDLFNVATIIRMIKQFQILLEVIIANPEQRLLDLPLLSKEIF